MDAAGFRVVNLEGQTIHDNRFIGMFKIKGSDFDHGVVAAGSELECSYEVLDFGNIVLEVSVPSIGSSFHSGHNFYSRQEGQVDYARASKLIKDQSLQTRSRLNEMSAKVDDPRLNRAREKLQRSESLDANQIDPEAAKEAMDGLQEAKRLLAISRKEHLREIRQLELDKTVELFTGPVRKLARPSEISTFDNLIRTAQRAIDNNSNDFEVLLDEMRGRAFAILWRQDWFVIDRFKYLAEETHLFPDAREHSELVDRGTKALNENDIEKLREIVARLDVSSIGPTGEGDMFADVNIVRI